MKVKDAIRLLSEQDPESELYTYVEEAEEFGSTDSIKYIENELDLPYARCGYPSIAYGEKIVLISGWCF